MPKDRYDNPLTTSSTEGLALTREHIREQEATEKGNAAVDRSPSSSWPHRIWAAVPTPFCADETIDFPGIAHNVRHYRDTLGLAGIFCNGLMGEGWSLSEVERRQILEATVEATAGALPVGVVTTHGSISETLALSRHAIASGADHIVLTRPAALFSIDELTDFVRMVSDAAQSRIVLFDSEAQSGGFRPEVIRTLARERRVHAVKCTRDADTTAALRAECGEFVAICDPYESHALANLTRFDQRGLYADPEPYLYQTADVQGIRAYFDAHGRGDVGAMLAEHGRLEPLRRVYAKWIERPLRRGLPINAALKHWCRRVGLAAGPARRPLHPLTESQAAALDKELDDAFKAALGTPL
jgi:4-hydroxy-tetrahydrodipicolinate synthase